MEAAVDAVGRVVVPKRLPDAPGLTPASPLDNSRYRAEIDDEVLFGLIDTGQR
ncbi:MAG: hypothetical protein ACRDZ8_14005 [Acidimicrobiales bacterium]